MLEQSAGGSGIGSGGFGCSMSAWRSNMRLRSSVQALF
jgi:hypothetical protein